MAEVPPMPSISPRNWWGRYQMERPGMFAIALTTDSSALTAISNDYGFDSVFARQLEALAGEGDLFIGLSTSGNSPNIIAAFVKAHEKDIRTVAPYRPGRRTVGRYSRISYCCAPLQLPHVFRNAIFSSYIFSANWLKMPYGPAIEHEGNFR